MLVLMTSLHNIIKNTGHHDTHGGMSTWISQRADEVKDGEGCDIVENATDTINSDTRVTASRVIEKYSQDVAYRVLSVVMESAIGFLSSGVG
jgi:hypothetical protein